MSQQQVDAAKKAAAEAACAYIKDGTDIGLGTGSTTDHAVRRIGEMVKDGLRVRGVPTSIRTKELAEKVGIPLVEPWEVDALDVTIDGADEVDPNLDLIKGLGGALLREKIVASITNRQIIVVDEAKLVQKLGTRSPLPVEVVPFGARIVERKLRELGHAPTLRTDKHGAPAFTDNENHVLDVRFADGIADAPRLERDLNTIAGVVDNGLFLGLTWRVIVGQSDGKVREISR